MFLQKQKNPKMDHNAMQYFPDSQKEVPYM